MSNILNEGLSYDDVQIEPCFSRIESRKNCDLSSILIGDEKIHIPIVSSPMDTVTESKMINALADYGAVGVLHRFMSKEKQLEEVDKCIWNSAVDFLKTRVFYRPVVAIGTTDDYLDRVKLLYENKVRIFLIDVAHGHSIHVKRAINDIKSKYNDVKIIAGNIATATAAGDLAKWGADALRVGIGNGSLCETRIRTGIGIPQITAIQRVYESSAHLPIIADGGIRTPGDVAKAIAAGADTVMIGSLFAGTKESPGRLIREGFFPNEQLFKIYRGSASLSAKIDRGEDDNYIEGNSMKIPYKGKVGRIVEAIRDGLASSMSYVGATNIQEFRKNARFIRVTLAGQIEAQPHLLL